MLFQFQSVRSILFHLQHEFEIEEHERENETNRMQYNNNLISCDLIVFALMPTPNSIGV